MNVEHEADHLEQLVMNACSVIATTAEVASITVVGHRRLTYRELERIRTCAAHRRASLTMAGNGTFKVRRNGAAAREERNQSAETMSWERV